MNLLPQAFLQFSTHDSSLHVFAALQLGDPPAEEPHLDDVSHEPELEEGDLRAGLWTWPRPRSPWGSADDRANSRSRSQR